MKAFMIKGEDISCKGCSFYSYDYGMMGFEDEESCRKMGVDFRKVPFGPDSFWCKYHTDIKPVNFKSKESKEKESANETGGFYKKNKKPDMTWLKDIEKDMNL